MRRRLRDCSGIAFIAWGGWSDETTDCTQTQLSDCPVCRTLHPTLQWAQNPDRKKASARHLGGNNVGFLDGHAAWFAAGRIFAMDKEGDLEGTFWWCEPCRSPDAYRAYCGSEPDPAMILLY